MSLRLIEVVLKSRNDRMPIYTLSQITFLVREIPS